MKNILFCCNTHYQLILAIQMANTLFKNDKVTFFISDHSNKAYFYAKNLIKAEGENSVRFINTKKLDYTAFNFRLKLFIYKLLIYNRFPFSNFPNEKYDEFITYNDIKSTILLANYLKKRNPKLIISRMEEGILSYNNILSNRRIRKSLDFILKEKIGFLNLKLYNKNFYSVYPRLYSGKLNPVSIPHIDTHNSSFIELIRNIFGIEIKKLKYPQKYIFFSSVCDFEGGTPIGELELIKKISEIVGKKNLLVKVHPRDNIKRFIDEGLVVDENSSNPWEAIQLNYDFSNHVFLTICSGSVLSISPIISNPPKTIFLYNLIKTSNELFNNTVKNFIELREKISKFNEFDFIKVASNLSDIIQG